MSYKLTTHILTGVILAVIMIAMALILTVAFPPPCLPDTEDRFFMGTHQGECLYMDMNTREVYKGE